MRTDPVPIKTAAGYAELSTRRHGLSQRHRTLLHLVDGRRSEAEVRRMAAQAGVPGDIFGELLRLGLIERQGSTQARAAPRDVAALTRGRPAAPPHTDWRNGLVSDSELPALLTLPPTSSFADTGSGSPAPPSSWFMTDPIEDPPSDEALERARDLLIRTLRAEAPVAGSLTTLRLWRASSREELRTLIEQVEARVAKPRRSLSTSLALQQARTLLAGPRQLGWGSR